MPLLPRLLRVAVLLPALLAPGLGSAERALPARDLLIELREADAAAAPDGGWTARSADASAARERPTQKLRVLNGASAAVSLGVTRPVQVWQMVPGVLLPAAVPGTQWIRAGQSLNVRPRWGGGSEPVVIELQLQDARFERHVAPGSAEAPSRNEAQVLTTLRVPLGQWVTFAATGAGADDATVVSSGQAAPAARRALQLRVDLAR